MKYSKYPLYPASPSLCVIHKAVASFPLLLLPFTPPLRTLHPSKASHSVLYSRVNDRQLLRIRAWPIDFARVSSGTRSAPCSAPSTEGMQCFSREISRGGRLSSSTAINSNYGRFSKRERERERGASRRHRARPRTGWWPGFLETSLRVSTMARRSFNRTKGVLVSFRPS